MVDKEQLLSDYEKNKWLEDQPLTQIFWCCFADMW